MDYQERLEHEQENKERADYGKQTLKQLSKDLTKEFGKGFSVSNRYNMRLFYMQYQKFQTVSGKLSWSHYCELFVISDPDNLYLPLRTVIAVRGKSEQRNGACLCGKRH